MLLSVILFAIISYSLALPASPNTFSARSVIDNGITEDGPHMVSAEARNSLPLICPYGTQNGTKAKNILYIHGTAVSGNLSFSGGLPDAFEAGGYSSCWINLPDFSLGDAQLTSEYVVTAIDRLYNISGNTPINIIGHSQGNLNIQWALNFFPSTRPKVASYAAFAADFQGTDEGPLTWLTDKIGHRGSMQSVLQQVNMFGKRPKFIEALNKHGNKALVPTTSMYGKQDEVIQIVETATSLGPGGAPFTHIAVQEICPDLFVDHALIILNRVAFYLALDAFDHGSNADVKRVIKSFPDICMGQFAPDMDDLVLFNLARLAISSMRHLGTGGRKTKLARFRTKVEPPLVPYALNQP